MENFHSQNDSKNKVQKALATLRLIGELYLRGKLHDPHWDDRKAADYFYGLAWDLELRFWVLLHADP